MSAGTEDSLLPAEDGFDGALSRSERPPRAGAVSASLTLGWRALLKIKHVPFQLFDVTAFPIMFTLSFTYLFGGALAGSPQEYIQFLLPGILVQTIVFITVYTGFGLNTDLDNGLFDRFQSLPIWQPAPIVGALLGDVVRYCIAAFVVVGLGVALGFRPGAGVLGILLGLALVLVFAFSLSWIWILVGLSVEKPESVMTMSFVLLFPLTFVSNIFVDPATMPPWLQTVVALNPVTHLVDATRGFMHGGVAFADVVWVFAASAIIVAVFAPLSMRKYRQER
ncbi:ABC transporter permease [Halopelagius longus]|uniref:ABC transporter permease n=1 Tax=Halopelagius longus TaxID=1236180 RepID=A0A1H1FYE8_9EURY|nr:ABC transporter permease [Halopelagius longus]RDI69953.1 ABC transporter permease [Halopelagius longus]SDR05945.1 ABC-2 type transport system permease protein [Halopelagius longus]